MSAKRPSVRTAKHAIKLMETVAATKPKNYVYPRAKNLGTCLYVYRDRPSCIVGRALVLAGYPVEKVAELDHWDDKWKMVVADGSPCAASTISDIWSSVSHEAAMAFNEVQSRQDEGSTWRDAIDNAKHALASFLE